MEQHELVIGTDGGGLVSCGSPGPDGRDTRKRERRRAKEKDFQATRKGTPWSFTKGESPSFQDREPIHPSNRIPPIMSVHHFFPLPSVTRAHPPANRSSTAQVRQLRTEAKKKNNSPSPPAPLSPFNAAPLQQRRAHFLAPIQSLVLRAAGRPLQKPDCRASDDDFKSSKTPTAAGGDRVVAE